MSIPLYEKNGVYVFYVWLDISYEHIAGGGAVSEGRSAPVTGPDLVSPETQAPVASNEIEVSAEDEDEEVVEVQPQPFGHWLARGL